jgi:thioredoxin 1
VGNVLVVNDENFAAEVAKAKGLVMVDFSAEWCGPCRLMAPILEEFAAEVSGRAKVCTLDVEQAPKITAQWRVLSLPTLLFIRDGQEVGRVIGLTPKEALVAKLAGLGG